MIVEFVATIKTARNDMRTMLEDENMTGKLTRTEDACYKKCYDLLHGFIENRRRQVETGDQA
jgi:hypothetical protein